MIKKIFLLFFLLFLFCLSYTRDTLFILMNAVMLNDPDNYANTAIPDFIQHLNVTQIKQLKWVLAGVFSGLFMLTTSACIHFYFKNKTYTRLSIGIYAALGILALLAELINHYTSPAHNLANFLH